MEQQTPGAEDGSTADAASTPDATSTGTSRNRSSATSRDGGATAVRSGDDSSADSAADDGATATGRTSRRGRRRRREQPRTPGQKFLSLLGEIAFIVIGALVISAVLRGFIAQMFIIPSGSMENTLQVNDRVVVSKITHIHRGDVVVFADPGDWLGAEGNAGSTRTGAKKLLEDVGLLPSTSNNHLIKRVIGMPGDHVKCCDAQGRMSVNGQPLDESSYLYVDPTTGERVKPANVPFDVVVPANHIWVMGDHRDASYDSRCHLQTAAAGGTPGSDAFVPMSDVVGPAVAIAAPLNRLRHLTVPSTFHAVPAASTPAPATAVVTEGAGC